MIKIEEITKYVPGEEWMVPVFLSLLFLVAWVRNNYPRRFQRLIRSLVNRQSLFQVMSEELIFSHRGSVLLTVVYIGATAVFLTLASEVFGFEISWISGNFSSQFVFWSLFIIGVYLVKWVLSGLFLALIGQKELFRTHMFIVSVFNKTTGIILLIISIAAAYTPFGVSAVLLKTGLVAWAGLLLFRIYKEVSISAFLKVSWFYNILYLCAFEISPFLIGLKMVKEFNF